MDEPVWNSRPSIFPHLYYPDPKGAVTFLERAFDFRTHFEAADENGRIRAKLTVGRGSILVGSAETPHFMYRTPREAGGVNTGAPYIATGNVDALYRRAKNAGAEVVRELADTEYGSRNFAARDPDGYLWSFGTYRPSIDGTEVDSSEAEVFEALRYERPRTAMGWLCEAFGFEEHSLVSGDGEDIRHALLRFQGSLLMVSRTREGDPLKLMPPHQASQPHLDGVHTQVIHVVVSDPDAHCAQAKESGGAVLEPPSNTSWGARRYIVRDPEGYVWCFSTESPTPQADIDKSASTSSQIRAL